MNLDDWINLDLSAIMDATFIIIFKIIRIPFDLWFSTPFWVKLIAILLIISFTLFVLYTIIKRRYEWREYVH